MNSSRAKKTFSQYDGGLIEGDCKCQICTFLNRKFNPLSQIETLTKEKKRQRFQRDLIPIGEGQRKQQGKDRNVNDNNQIFTAKDSIAPF